MADRSDRFDRKKEEDDRQHEMQPEMERPERCPRPWLCNANLFSRLPPELSLARWDYGAGGPRRSQYERRIPLGDRHRAFARQHIDHFRGNKEYEKHDKRDVGAGARNSETDSTRRSHTMLRRAMREKTAESGCMRTMSGRKNPEIVDSQRHHAELFFDQTVQHIGMFV